jgi:hypothetical protein
MLRRPGDLSVNPREEGCSRTAIDDVHTVGDVAWDNPARRGSTSPTVCTSSAVP